MPECYECYNGKIQTGLVSAINQVEELIRKINRRQPHKVTDIEFANYLSQLQTIKLSLNNMLELGIKAWAGKHTACGKGHCHET